MVRLQSIAFFMLTLSALWLEGVAQAGGGGRLDSVDSGLSGIYTAQAVISDDAHHVLMGHVIVAARGGERHIALIIQQRREGVHYLRYSRAFSGGLELPYRRMGGTGCTHGHCRDRPVGLIALSAPMLTRFAQTGLNARLNGRSGTIRLSVPAPLFAEAADRARISGLFPPTAPD